MKLALLKGNRFNPWHLRAYTRLRGIDVVGFRAESEIQRYFDERDDGSVRFPTERLYFDTQAGPPARRLWNALRTRLRGREPRLLPFHERLRGFDLIHTWELFTDWSAEAAIARARYGIPLCVMVWDNIPFNMETSRERRAIKQEVIRSADRFLVHTERSRRVLGLEGVDLSKVIKLDPAVDTDSFAPGEGRRGAFQLPLEGFIILFVGWLLPRKGIDFLLLALHELLHDAEARHLRPHLVIVGSGPGQDRVNVLIKRLGIRHDCTFIPSLPYARMPEVFRCADVFALPSIAAPDWQEQFGMSIIEAMSCGVPVVTTWSGAIPEMTDDAAVLCQPNDFLSLYEALRGLMVKPESRAELGTRGRRLALERYQLQDFADRLARVYHELVSGR